MRSLRGDVTRQPLPFNIAFSVKSVNDIGKRRSSAGFGADQVVPAVGFLGRHDNRQAADGKFVDEGVSLLPLPEQKKVAAAGTAEN